MAGKVKDITGQRFGRLTVIRFVEVKDRQAFFECVCDCGNHTIVSGHSLRRGHTKSCGCLWKEYLHTSKCHNRTHNMKNTRIYNIWQHMKARCRRVTCKSYADYGERGITYCKEWEHFEPFYEWAMANGYNDELTIDRIDVNGIYEPSNCRWVTRAVQNRNKRNTKYFTIDGETKSIAEWADIYGVSVNRVFSRISRGWDTLDAIQRPLRRSGNITKSAHEERDAS